MKYLIVVLLAVWGFVQLTTFFFNPKSDPTSATLIQFAEAPTHRLSDPYRNGYFYLLGLLAASSQDPAKVGYDMWVENREASRRDSFNYAKAGRAEYRLQPTSTNMLAAWEAEDPLEAFRARQSPVRDLATRHQVLLNRYHRCISMPFEDWGYGFDATPRFVEPMILHRLYVAQGFAQSTTLGIERMYRELIFWRTVLREAATPATKVLASVVLRDDAAVLSRMLSRPSVDKALMAAGLQLTLPLTPSEYSIRWPVQHEVALSLRHRTHSSRSDETHLEAEEAREWLEHLAHLPAQTFDKLAHPATSSWLTLGSQQTENLYAAYYEAVIKGSGAGQGTLPRLDQIARTMRRGIFDQLLSPALVEPQWDILIHQLMETDTRLRLTSLQIQLRRHGSTVPVPTRLAEVGSQYFDPFTGLPMLWSPTQQRLYSVGKDRLDDGGDPSFDITVPAVLTAPSAPPPSTRPTGKQAAASYAHGFAVDLA